MNACLRSMHLVIIKSGGNCNQDILYIRTIGQSGIVALCLYKDCWAGKKSYIMSI